MIVDDPLLAAEQIYLHIFALLQRPALFLLVGVGVRPKPLLLLAAWLHLLDLNPLVTGEGVEGRELNIRDLLGSNATSCRVE